MPKIVIQNLKSHYQWYEREFEDIEIKKAGENLEWYIQIWVYTISVNELKEGIELLRNQD